MLKNKRCIRYYGCISDGGIDFNLLLRLIEFVPNWPEFKYRSKHCYYIDYLDKQVVSPNSFDL